MRLIDCFGLSNTPKMGRASCLITFRKDCDGCPFYKTHQQFNAAQKDADRILYRKGLRPCVKTVKQYYPSGGSYEKQIMSTVRRERNDNCRGL